jgi:cytochrome P450
MAVVTIGTYKEAEDALKRTDLRQALYDEGAILMKKVLVNLHGDEHLARKRVVTKVLRPAFFAHYEKNVFGPTLEQTLAPYVAAGKADMVEFGYRVMVNLTADFAGIDRTARSIDETDSIVTLLRTFGKAATLGQALGDRAAIRADIQRGLDAFDAQFFTPSLRRREALLAAHARGEIAEAELPRDMLLVMLQANEELRESHDVLMKEMAFYLMAGAHTSIHSMTHAVHEFLEWVKAHPEDRQRADDDPFFLQRCVYESIRLHPSSPTACRRPTAPTELPGMGSADPGRRNRHRSARRESRSADVRRRRRNVQSSSGGGPARQPRGAVVRHRHARVHRSQSGRGQRASPRHVPGRASLRHHSSGVARAPRPQCARRSNETARADSTTVRKTWAYYPLLFD